MADLQDALSAWRRDSRVLGERRVGAEAELDPDQIERLQELGYLAQPDDTERRGTRPGEGD